MSYPGLQGYNGSYGSSNSQSGAYGARRSSSAAAPPLTSAAYPVSSSQQQYGSAAYAWPDRNQSSYGNINSNTRHYGNHGWKNGQGQQPMYDYQRPQTNYAASSTTTHNPHGWYNANSQPQAQPSTQALSNLAYASGLDSQEQQPHGDRRSAYGHPGSQHPDSAQREGSGQERVQSPSYDRMYISSYARTSQTSQSEQSPTSAHQNLAASAAAALAGAVNRRHNSSPEQPRLSAQQYQPSAPPVANAVDQNSENAVTNQHQQQLTSSHDNNARGQLQTLTPPIARVQPSQYLNRYETNETHRYAHSSCPSVTLPLPSAIRVPQPKPSCGPTQRTAQNNAGAGHSPEKADTSSLGTMASNSIETSNDMSRLQHHEPAISMPTFIDPSQVFNPYHKEHERQKREEAERAKRASTEASEQNTGSKVKEASTNPAVSAAGTTTASGSKQQGRVPATTDTAVRLSSRSSSMTAELKESVDVDMASEMKAMMHRMREWKTKDPSLFQKLWGDMKKGGGGTQATKGQTPAQSPQLTQVAPQQPSQSQSSQPAHPQPSPAPQRLSQNQNPPSRTASETSSKPKRLWGLTMVVENNDEGLPDLGRFPAGRRKRRTNQEIAEAKASREEAKRSAQKHPTVPTSNAKATPSTVPTPSPAQTPITISPARATEAKQDEKLTWPTQSATQPPPTTNAMSMVTPTQTLPPMSLNGVTIWPEAKRKALAEAARKALLGLPANKDKSITAAEIHALLEQNPSYIELCGKLEARGFVFHRGQFARFLLNNVPDLSSPSQTQPKTVQQPALSISSPSQPPQQVVPTRVATPLATANGSAPHSHPPARPSAHIKCRLAPAPPPKATPNRPAKPRLGVPSPTIPTPVPGSKEANARKRDFSELVDLTQLSDDEDYVMPRKQARHEASPEKEVSQVKSDILLPNAARQMSNMQRHSYGPSHQNPYGPPGGTAPLKFDPQLPTLVSQLQSHAPAQASQAMPQKSRHLLAKPLNKAEALRKSYYDPKTVARDILIAAGRHPGEHPLNAHLAGLLGKHIDIDSDLSTFDWDSVDPGGPPVPVVQMVDIPAGPPRWKVGQRTKVRGPTMGTFDPPSKVRPNERVKSPDQRATVSNGIPTAHVGKGSSKEKPNKGHAPDGSSLARQSSQTKSLVEDSSNTQPKPSHQPTRSRQSQNVDVGADEDSKSRIETTPHRPQSITPIFISNSLTAQNPPKRGPGRPRKSSIMDEPSPAPMKRRGRPPGSGSGSRSGSKNKPLSAYMLKKAAKTSGLQVSVPAPRRSTSPPQYNIYTCQWRTCDAKLHNLSTLRKHIAKVHKIPNDETKSEGQPCWWENCRTLEDKGEGIVTKVTFNSASDWLDHVESDHLHPLGMKLGDGPSSTQTGKPKPFEVSKYFYHPPRANTVLKPVSNHTRTCSHTDPQTLARDRQIYLSDHQGRAVTAPSTKTTILDYPSDTLVLSSATMNPESNIPNRAFSKAHGNEKMEIRQSAIETLLALQRHKERVGPGLDRGGCTLVNAERRATLLDSEGMMRVVDADY